MYKNIYFDRQSDTIHLWDDEHEYCNFQYEPYAYRKSPGGEFKSIFGDDLEKVYNFDSAYGGGLFESDVPPETRTLIDLYGDDDTPSTGHNIFNFDIETGAEGGYAKPEDPWQPITSIAFKDSKSQIRRVYVIDSEDLVGDSEYDDDIGHVVIRSFKTEVDLLDAFIDEFQRISPTILTGWNILGYDVPYLCLRIKKVLKKRSNDLSPIGIIKIRQNNKEKRFDCSIAGMSCLDYLDLYRLFTYTQLPNYRLGTVGSIEIGMDKLEYDGNLNDLFHSDINKFVQYNLTDIDIVDGLDNKMKLIELVLGICHVCHVPYENIRFSSRFLEGAILTYLRRKNVVATNRPKRKRKDEVGTAFEGAYVKPPIPGKYNWIHSADLNSLYPSAIRSLNISPETKVGKVYSYIEPAKQKPGGKVGEMIPAHPAWDPVEYMNDTMIEVYTTENDTWSKTNSLPLSEFKEKLKSQELAISSAGVIYKQDFRGIIPEILDKWYAERKEYKAKMVEASDAGDKGQEEYFDRRQLIQKVFLNSLYGVLGLDGWRFYDLDNALSVTATGQNIIKQSAIKSNEAYFDLLTKAGKHDYEAGHDFVTYVDTDSVAGESKLKTSEYGEISIETLFSQLENTDEKITDSANREFIFPEKLHLPYFDEQSKTVKTGRVQYLEKHLVKKKRFKIKTKGGKEVIVSEDHSVMVEDLSGKLIEKKPMEIKKGDKVVTI